MVVARSHDLQRYLEHLVGVHASSAVNDQELLERFVHLGDTSAFAEVLRRHGPMVLGVCRRALDREQDAEDAFQAVFLVLARRASSIRRRQALPAYLHAVACRVARKLRARLPHPTSAELPPVVAPDDPPAEASRREMARLLDEELSRLPETYRAPLVLCYLDGLTRDEAALRLGWSLGTLKRRLEQGRKSLRSRLLRRGALPAGLVATVLTPEGLRAAVSPALLEATVQASQAFAAGGAATTTAARLAAAVLHGFWLNRMNAVLLVLVLMAGLAGAGAWASGILAQRPPVVPNPPPALPSRPEQAALAHNPEPARDRAGDPLPPLALARLGTTRLTHRNNVGALAISPDGKTLASAGYDNLLRLWDAASGRPLRQVPHKGWVRAVVWSSDGKRLITGADQEGIRIFDAESCKEIQRLTGTEGMIVHFSQSADGRLLASDEQYEVRVGNGSHSGYRVRLWDLSTGRQLRQHTAEHPGWAALSADGKLLARGDGPRIHLWETATGKELASLLGGKNVYAVAFSPRGRALAVAYSYIGAGDVRLIDWTNGKEIGRMPGHRYSSIYALAFSVDGGLLAAGFSEPDSSVRLMDTTTGKPLRRLPVSCGLVDALCFFPSGRTLIVAGGRERSLTLWDVRSGEEISPCVRHHGPLTALASAPDGKTLATGSTDRTARLWTSRGEEITRLEGHPGPVTALAFAPNGKLVASGSSRGDVRLWDPATGKELRRLTGHALDIADLAFAPDGRRLASIDARADGFGIPGAQPPDGTLRIWDVATGKQLHLVQPRIGGLHALVFAPDGKTLALAGRDDHAIHLFNPATGKELRRLQPAHSSNYPFEGITGLTFSPDGRTLASIRCYEYKSNKSPLRPWGEERPGLRLWEMSTGRERLCVRFPENLVCRAAYSPDGRLLVLGCRDGTTRLLDPLTGKECGRLRGHEDSVNVAAFSPNARLLVTGSADTTALVWDGSKLPRTERGAVKLRTEREREALWTDLGSDDAARAYQAVAELSAVPREAVALLRPHLVPVSREGLRRTRGWLRDLDADDYAVRETATRELERLGETVRPLLEEALKQTTAPEAKRRLQRLLGKITSGSGKAFQSARAVEVLEHLGTLEARAVLEALAQGDGEAHLTKDARASLRRLERRSQ